ncbi:PorP/SprF family type IX secretion system membrane protein [Brumimicrobium aurantiacum]|uniref:Type IX secretion system membrane protein PorP/SprF n=1 Tax=Brumimicrobium aurantiacum TaxID=1737063 RepID=A0A3E1EV42_9FLAO|nr:PorP/SprF family type IX secretion system membrane protein [Brumimicrobium aurantiacum]RFC53436.1 type IX secretion system membrane protein PorP/SprF [Brumimicrobium aurantiacum]
MKKLVLISILISSCLTSTFAQQDKVLTHFIFDKMSINPGATGVGMGHEVCGTMIYRNQWDQFNGAPNSVLANAEANISRYVPSAAGISFYHDAIGYSRQNNVTLNYSYHLSLANGTLGIGAALGLNSFSMSPTWVTPDGNPFDGSLPQAKSQATFDANFGLYYMSHTGWYAGLSSTHLPAAEITDLNFNTARHYYAMGGYRMNKAFDIDQLSVEANGMIRSDLKFVSADVNFRAIWDDTFYGGLTYRTTDALAVMLGLNWNSFTFGYSYDITVNRISSVSTGSHELMVKYCYPLPKIPITVVKNPRYL